MQFDPAQSVLAPSSSQNPQKRAIAGQAAQQELQFSSKVPRVDSPPTAPSAFSYSRQTTAPKNNRRIPMPHNQHSRPKQNKRTSHSAGPSRRIRRVLEGPLHDEAFIKQEYNTSPIPIKQQHVDIPKSAIGNFASAALGKTPTYKVTDGALAQDPRTHVWRYAFNTHSSDTF